MTAKSVLLCLCAGLFFCNATHADRKNNTGVIIRGAYWLKDVRVIQGMPKAFSSSQNVPAKAVNVGWDDRGSLGRFADKDAPFDVLIHNAIPNAVDKRALSRSFPKGSPQPAKFLMGQQCLVVIVNRGNSVDKIALTQIQQLLRKKGKGLRWKTLGGNDSVVKCYGEDKKSWSRDVIHRKCLAFTENFDWGSHNGWYLFREDFEERAGADEIIKKVKANPKGIGFFQCRGQPIKGLKDVKVLAIGKTDKGPFVKPKLEPVIQEDYPLAEPLILYLHPKAPPLAKKFCEFCVSEEGAKIAAKHGLITPWAEKWEVGKKRLRQMKAGKGPKVKAVGARDCRKLMDSLAVEYVMAKAVIQMKYSGLDERPAVGRFATDVAKAVAGEKVSAGSPQLLLLDGPMSEKTKDANRDKLEVAKPERHVLAACGVAVIVNPKNPLKSIAAEQVVEIFKGKTKSWTDLAPEFKADKLDITCYSPIPRQDAAIKYFHRDILHAVRRTNVRYCKTADSVIGFVASTPGGIGVVNVRDLALPSAQAGVKVLAIGPANSTVLPKTDNIFAGKYPLGRQMILYVSPKASEETKDFVKFILSGTCDETFRKAGLVTSHSKITMPNPKQSVKKIDKPGKGKNAKLPKWKKTEPAPQTPGGW
jgi:ABC-type phosphate transport system substrate-binding protein